MGRDRKKIGLVKLSIVAILFFSAILYEHASGYRFILLLLIFVMYNVNGFMRFKLEAKKKLYSLSYILDIGMIFLLEHYSRFMINYFIHAMYLVVLLEITITLNRKNVLRLGVITSLVSFIKYGLLIYYTPSATYIAEMLFFMMVSIFTLVVANFAHKTREEKEEKDQIYKELLKTHKKLKEYTEEVERLSKTEERNRIARDLHDDLGHNMTALIMKLEMTEHILGEDVDAAKGLLASSKEMARKGLRDIRNVVETLRRVETNNLNGIDGLIKAFAHNTQVKIYSTIACDEVVLTNAIEETLYKLVKESLTNAVRHGKATEIRIEIKSMPKGIEFSIEDNGIGTEGIIEGYGLKGMRERIQALKGEIAFSSEDGFKIIGIIPEEVKR